MRERQPHYRGPIRRGFGVVMTSAITISAVGAVAYGLGSWHEEDEKANAIQYSSSLSTQLSDKIDPRLRTIGSRIAVAEQNHPDAFDTVETIMDGPFHHQLYTAEVTDGDERAIIRATTELTTDDDGQAVSNTDRTLFVEVDYKKGAVEKDVILVTPEGTSDFLNHGFHTVQAHMENNSPTTFGPNYVARFEQKSDDRNVEYLLSDTSVPDYNDPDAINDQAILDTTDNVLDNADSVVDNALDVVSHSG